MLLILIYYFKGTLSLQDIQAVLEPIGEEVFPQTPDAASMTFMQRLSV